MLAQVCAALDCAPVQHLGKVLVLWRPNPGRSKPKAPPKPPARKKPAVRTPVDPVRERRRAARTPHPPAAGDQARRRRRAV
jgi:RNA-binding protein